MLFAAPKTLGSLKKLLPTPFATAKRKGAKFDTATTETGAKGSIGPERNMLFQRLSHPLMSLDGKSLDESSKLGSLIKVTLGPSEQG